MTSIRPLVPIALVLLAAAGAATAQPYKVVGPDGKVTYTDRPPTSGGKVSALGARNAPVVSENPLPAELREPVSRYPVTLYTTSGACEPCSGARALLRQRGVPYAERQVVTAEDNDALARITGGREVPVLTIGAQSLKGFAAETWVSYLDAAGYPRESKLPPGYQYPAPAPLVERRPAAEAAAAPQRPAAAPAEEAPSPPPLIRF
jgi:glutaredoxin